MHRVARVAGLVVIVLLGAGVGATARSESGVSIQLFQFRPGRLETTRGTPIVFTNQDDIEHTATSGDPGRPDGRFAVVLRGKGQIGQVALASPGVYPYFCSRHSSMRGEIRVE